MAQARMCDRCGSMFRTHSYDDFPQVSWSDARINEETIDLCLKCEQELFDWLNANQKIVNDDGTFIGRCDEQ